MRKRFQEFLRKHHEVAVYLVFGVLTTLVNYIVYIPLFYGLKISATVSNLVAWTVAVAVAFITNKLFVFDSHNWTFCIVLPEILKFTGCRVGSGLAETFLLWVTVDLLQWDGFVWKLIASIFVVILNYVSSKLIVFRRKRQ